MSKTALSIANEILNQAKLINIEKENDTMTTTNKEITKVQQISNDFIEEFYKTANTQDREWIKIRTAELTIEFGKAKYFFKFRAEFAKKFLPHIVASKKIVNKKTLLERLIEIDNMSVA